MQSLDQILILTPIKDAEKDLETYFRNLYNLEYPHQNISLGFLESDSSDNSYPILKQKESELKKEFRKVGLWKKDFGFKIPEGKPRWEGKIQYERRAILAKSRNHLLFHALNDEDWVLWLDADVVEYPSTIIQRLLQSGKDIVQPNCILHYHGISYDLNAWRDKGKKHLHDLRKEGILVKLHAVGGSMLLVRADIHRDGLIFPPFLYGQKNTLIRKQHYYSKKTDLFKSVLINFLKKQKIDLYTLFKRYKGEIETEGLGILAYDMGYECWGMPYLEIRHKNC
jgi:hypothetical protein